MVHSAFFRFVSFSVCFLLTDAGELLEIEPSRLVVEYGTNTSAVCSTTQKHNGMGWEASQGAVEMQENVNLITWVVDELTHWEIKPLCYINLVNGVQYSEQLPVVIYKLPDKLSTKLNNCTGPVLEGENCLLQCDIQNVAPVGYLYVTWYKQELIMANYSFLEKTIRPVNTSVNLMVKVHRTDHGAKYSCEVKLELGPVGLPSPPTKRSDPLYITVHYKPEFSVQKEVINMQDKESILNCSTRANPPSNYGWNTPDPQKNIKSLNDPTLSVSQPGIYTCTASNPYGTATKEFIVESNNRTILWAVVVSGIFLALVLIMVCIICTKPERSANHNIPQSSAEGEELVSPVQDQNETSGR